jgi:hypothetical protein
MTSGVPQPPARPVVPGWFAVLNLLATQQIPAVGKATVIGIVLSQQQVNLLNAGNITGIEAILTANQFISVVDSAKLVGNPLVQQSFTVLDTASLTGKPGANQILAITESGAAVAISAANVSLTVTNSGTVYASIVAAQSFSPVNSAALSGKPGAAQSISMTNAATAILAPDFVPFVEENVARTNQSLPTAATFKGIWLTMIGAGGGGGQGGFNNSGSCGGGGGGGASRINRVFLPVGTTPPAVTFGSVGAGNAGAVASVNYLHTIVGNCIVVVLQMANAALLPAASAMVGSTPMVEIGRYLYGNDGTYNYHEVMFGLIKPTGADWSAPQTITVSSPGSVNMVANSVSYNNVFGFGSQSNSNVYGVGVTSLSHSVPSIAGNMVVQAFAGYNQNFSAYNQTSRYLRQYQGSVTNPLQIGDAAGAATVNFSITGSASTALGSLAVTLFPTPALGSTYSVTVGAGGISGAGGTFPTANVGGDGGDTIFTSGNIKLVAGGGKGGGKGFNGNGTSTGGAGGIASAIGISALMVAGPAGIGGATGSTPAVGVSDVLNNGCASGSAGGGQWFGVYGGNNGGSSMGARNGDGGAVTGAVMSPVSAGAGNGGAGGGGGYSTVNGDMSTGTATFGGGAGGNGGLYGGGAGGGTGNNSATLLGAPGGIGGAGYVLLEFVDIAPEENIARTNQPLPTSALPLKGLWASLIGAGGGGGGGRLRGGNNTVDNGGGGGGGGAFIPKNFLPLSVLGSDFSVTVPIGGAGAARQMTVVNPGSGSDGLPGTVGGNAVFSSGPTTLTAGGGSPGAGGIQTAITAAPGGITTPLGGFPGTAGGGSTGGNGAAGIDGPTKNSGGAGGGGGAGWSGSARGTAFKGGNANGRTGGPGGVADQDGLSGFGPVAGQASSGGGGAGVTSGSQTTGGRSGGPGNGYGAGGGGGGFHVTNPGNALGGGGPGGNGGPAYSFVEFSTTPAVGFDSMGAGYVGVTSPGSWLHTIKGNCLVVHMQAWQNNGQTPAVTAKIGTTDIPLARQLYYYTASGYFAVLNTFVLMNPPQGANQTITVTSVNISGGAMAANSASYYNVGSYVVNDFLAGTAVPAELRVPILHPGQMVSQAFSGYTAAMTGYNQTDRYHKDYVSGQSLTFQMGDAYPPQMFSASLGGGWGINCVRMLPIGVALDPVIIGSASAAATSVALPPHISGDQIVLFVYRDGVPPDPVKPTAGGTVPAWVDIDSVLAGNSNSCYTVTFKATASNHTSGVWTNATGIAAVVIRGAHPTTPIGGHMLGNGSIAGTVGIPSPAITLSDTRGKSIILECYGSRNVTAWNAPPTGRTLQTSVATEVCVNSKNDTTTDGSATQTHTVATASGYATAAIEILPPP